MPQYRSTQGLATAILVLLGIYLVANIVASLLAESTFNSSPTGFEARREYGAIGFAVLGLFIALAIMTPMWLARVHRNAEALSGQPLPKSAGWTAGSWFIPVVGGFLAAKPLGRIWERAPGGNKGRPLAWAVLWSVWQCAIVVFVVAVAVATVAEMSKHGNPSLLSEAEKQEIGEAVLGQFAFMDLLLTSILTVSGICMGLTVLAIQAAQSKAAQQRVPASPPPAPRWP